MEMAECRRRSCRLHWLAQLVIVALEICLLAIQTGEAIVKLVTEL